MGMYDTLRVLCPYCNHLNEIQSKAGDNLLLHYSLDNVPHEIMTDVMSERQYCESCGKQLRFAIINEPKYLVVGGDML